MIQAEGVKYDLYLNSRQFQDGIAQATNSTKALESSMSGLGSIIGATFGLAAITAFGAKMIQAGTTVENARIGLTTLLGDTYAAGMVIKNTLEDATKTPFAFEGLLAANKALISAGTEAKTARIDVLNLANAIAATGGGDDELQRMVINLQQIKNTGKATALDIKQFAYAGVNLYAALDAAGIKHAKDSELTYEQVTKALKVAHDEGGIYFNGLENMQASFSVQLSNLSDTVFRIAADAFGVWRKEIGGTASALQAMIGFVEEHEEAVGAAVVIIGVATGAIALITAGTWAWAAATTVATGGINLMIAGLALLAAAVAVAWKESQTLRSTVTGLFAVIKEFASTAGNIFGGLAKQIKGIFTFSPSDVSIGFEQMTTAMFGAGQRMKTAYQNGFTSVQEEDAQDERVKWNDFKVHKGLEKAKEAKKTALGKSSATPDKLKSNTERAQGQKITTINVSVGNLVKDFSVHTTNIKEGANKLQELVTNALKGALNEFQITAGQ